MLIIQNYSNFYKKDKLSFEEIFRDFIRFLRKPTKDGMLKLSPLNIIPNISLLFFIVLFVEMALIYPIFSIMDVDNMDHKITKMIESFSKFSIVLMTVIAAPFLEEIIFRFPLRFTRPTLFLLSGFVSFVVYNIVAAFSTVQLAYILSGSVFFFTVSIMLFYNHYSEEKLKNVVRQGFPIIFYLLIFFFAIVHIYNFENINSIWYLAPLLVLPQFILGIYLGYIRLRFGLIYCIFIHGLNNLMPTLIILIAK